MNEWRLADLVQNKLVRVFSCFSCGGGSSTGYKKAGFDVIGNVEIDAGMQELYAKNLHAKHSFTMDIRAFNQLENLPDEIFEPDILDSSPPCTTFSTVGKRERVWGVEKQFNEGTKKQRLDDLFLEFLQTVKKLRPRIVIAENVLGLFTGNARGYVHEILQGFQALKYRVQIFKLDASRMGVPQKRIRLFFIATRENFPPLRLSFREPPILFGQVRTAHGIPLREGSLNEIRLRHLHPSDRYISDIAMHVEGRYTGFSCPILADNRVASTLTASGTFYRACDKTRCSDDDFRRMQTFPVDYDFGGRSVQYVCGMSVPPIMMEKLALAIWEQWLS